MSVMSRHKCRSARTECWETKKQLSAVTEDNTKAARTVVHQVAFCCRWGE